MTETLIPAAPERVTPERVTPERVTPLRPSEALRLGRLTRPRRITGDLFDGNDGACAIGAMAEALGWVGADPVYPWMLSRWPALASTVSGCPENSRHLRGGATGLELIYHLNDSAHNWSDDQIVAWLQEIGL